MAVNKKTIKSSDSLTKTNISLRSELKELKARLHRTEEALKVSQTKYQQVIHHDSQGIRIINKDYTIQLINQAFTNISGVSLDDAIGKKCWEVFPSPICHTPNCRLKRVIEGEDLIQEEIERTKPDGQIIPCMVSATTLRDEDGKLSGVIETFTDIMEKVELKRQVKETEERYRALIELGTEAGEAIVMLQDTQWTRGHP
jgi:PAS domain S-box-containing protein